MIYDYSIIGGGIIGLSVGMELSRRYPKAKIVIIEKEAELSTHQTARNSGVIHSGVYYKPGSLKAKLAKEGNEQMVRFVNLMRSNMKFAGKS